MPSITVYGSNFNGTRSVGVDVNDITVLVRPATEDQNADALALAHRIDAAEAVREAQNRELESLKKRLKDVCTALEAERSVRAAAEAALKGQRRFFGPMLLKPAKPGVWSGEVWLLDPEKKERGFGMVFSSMNELHSKYPELWVICTTEDGILLDSYGTK